MAVRRQSNLHTFSLDISCELCYTEPMKQIIMAKLKLHTTPEQFQALRRTQLAYRDALNYVSRYAFEHGKMSNQRTVASVRCMLRYERSIHLPAQMACNVPRQVGATYKTLWTKVKQNAAHRQAGKTKKRYKGLDKPPSTFPPRSPTTIITTTALSKTQQVSILTLDGRVIVPYTGYTTNTWHCSRHGATYRGSQALV